MIRLLIDAAYAIVVITDRIYTSVTNTARPQETPNLPGVVAPVPPAPGVGSIGPGDTQPGISRQWNSQTRESTSRS